MKTELLSPAGNLDCFYQALYNGADAIYLATDKFGARAYAKNLTLEELKTALTFAHSKNAKVYVTVNTIIKENELDDAKAYVKKLYELGVDGLILADFALINYTNKYLKPMECHISTQAGVKDLEDVKFFEDLGVERTVIAREVSIDEIKKIKANSKMALEVFAYGALCVSYSGGCLFSSLLSLRSGNRGRCSQNCRREYKLYKNDNLIDSGFMLSMKDLNTYNNLKELLDAKVDSLKIEGRMKSPDYVKLVTSEFKNKIDNNKYVSNKLDTVFHRAYTKGFLFGENTANIVDINKKSNEGAYIGKIAKFSPDFTLIDIERPLNVGDRIKIETNTNPYYFTVDKLFDLNKKEIKQAKGKCLIKIYEHIDNNSKIYKMIDSTIDLSIDIKNKLPISLNVYGSLGESLLISTTINDMYFEACSDMKLDKAKTAGIDYNTLYKQLSKLNDTPYYLNDLNCYLDDNLFLTVSEINNTRRKLINDINNYFQKKRTLNDFEESFNTSSINYNNDLELTASCVTLEQYNLLKSLGIKTIYYNNYVPYVDAKYENIDEDYILAGNYGAIHKYKDKKIIADYSFNVINSDSIKGLIESGVDIVTLSVETDLQLIDEIYVSYKKKFNEIPPLEIIVYGHQNLMTMKYCTLKRYGECGKCKENVYKLKDDIGEFYLYNVNCINHIVNGKALNLVDDLNEIKKYTNRIRLSFTI
ncbi:MAG: U32 family peptidase, partial [Acholeplasmatales bacterium]|nr:U32 family peptidase [Acholeplasmatales bacterium]